MNFQLIIKYRCTGFEKKLKSLDSGFDKMKNSNPIILGAAVLVALIAVSGIALSTYAQNSDNATPNGQGRMRGWGNLSAEDKTEQEERREEHLAARTEIYSAMPGGYEAWKSAVIKVYGESAEILDQVTPANFTQYQEASNFMEQARTLTEKGRIILDDIGIKNAGFGSGNGMGMMKGGRGNNAGHACPMLEAENIGSQD